MWRDESRKREERHRRRDDVYEFHRNTDTHYDVSLRGEIVAELGYCPGLVWPDISRPIQGNVLTRLARLWGEHLERIGRI